MATAYAVVDNDTGDDVVAPWFANKVIRFPPGESKLPLSYWYGMKRENGIPAGVTKIGDTDENGSQVDVGYI